MNYVQFHFTYAQVVVIKAQQPTRARSNLVIFCIRHNLQSGTMHDAFS